MSNFSDCFGNLTEEDQKIMKGILTAMTKIINRELQNKEGYIQLNYP